MKEQHSILTDFIRALRGNEVLQIDHKKNCVVIRYDISEQMRQTSNSQENSQAPATENLVLLASLSHRAA